MGNTSNFDKFSEWDIGRTEIGWILIPPFPGSKSWRPSQFLATRPSQVPQQKP